MKCIISISTIISWFWIKHLLVGPADSFSDVQSFTRLFANNLTNPVYETWAGSPVVLRCETRISYYYGGFITVFRSLWRALGAFSELDTTSPLWSVMYDRVRKPGFLPDQSRMFENIPEHPSTKFMSTGVTIAAPLMSDTGMYYCSSIVIPRAGEPQQTLVSNQISLIVKPPSITTYTWFTYHGIFMAKQQNVYDQDFPMDIRCHSLVEDSYITSMQIYKSQSYFLNDVKFFETKWFLIYDSSAQESNITGSPLVTPTRPFRPGVGQMSFGLGMPVKSFAQTGSYKCRTYHTPDGSAPTYYESDVYELKVLLSEPPRMTCFMKFTMLDTYQTFSEVIPNKDVKIGKSDYFDVSCDVISANEPALVTMLSGPYKIGKLRMHRKLKYEEETKNNPECFTFFEFHQKTELNIRDIARACQMLDISITAWMPNRAEVNAVQSFTILSDLCPQTGSKLIANTALRKMPDHWPAVVILVFVAAEIRLIIQEINCHDL